MKRPGPWIPCPEAPALTVTLRHGERFLWFCSLFGHWMRWRREPGDASASFGLTGTCLICLHRRYTEHRAITQPTPIESDTDFSEY